MHGMEKSDEPKDQKYNQQQGTAAGMAAMLALSILLPNLNKATAYAMQSLPVIGEHFKLVTFRLKSTYVSA